ncbi:Holo-[acyl-carrier protein] synthase [Cystobacter fuscus DSM 2262]|uniref:Holo-[acyl-carrier-protein] synthase n=1 Tax=Cystobacter fuscus (strain ATCC 25194 / DSM 2262 / NBRC 100088 / M29) TaxID=1242864 RepID=S9QLH7_CYSF2|nr:holo-ACP synthase [Cystobacter fuscus]EPX57358.1 Holo-[acyl-carrier protein] synthase [Cystobacter fuscus DSM 2262]
MAIIGLGLDICSVERIQRILDGARAERFLERVYTPAERELCNARSDKASAYAARFAAKEALIKALGAPKGLTWHDMEVVRAGGPPGFRLSGVARVEMEKRRAEAFLALTHDAGVAAATVVLQERS